MHLIGRDILVVRWFDFDQIQRKAVPCYFWRGFQELSLSKLEFWTLNLFADWISISANQKNLENLPYFLRTKQLQDLDFCRTKTLGQPWFYCSRNLQIVVLDYFRKDWQVIQLDNSCPDRDVLNWAFGKLFELKISGNKVRTPNWTPYYMMSPTRLSKGPNYWSSYFQFS